MNVNEISRHLGLPQSTVATNIQVLEEPGLIATETIKAAQGPAEDLPARFDEIVIRLDGSDAASAGRPDRGRDAARPLHRLPGIGAVRPVLDRGHHRPARRAGLSSSTRGGCRRRWCGSAAAIVEYKFPNNAKLLERRGRDARVQHGAVLGGAGHQHRLALRHQPLGQRRAGRHLDLAGRLRRQARRLHAALVEAGGLAIRQARRPGGSPRAGCFVDGVTRLRRDDRRARARRAITRSACGSASTRTPGIPAASTSSGAASATTIRTS